MEHPSQLTLQAGQAQPEKPEISWCSVGRRTRERHRVTNTIGAAASRYPVAALFLRTRSLPFFLRRMVTSPQQRLACPTTALIGKAISIYDSSSDWPTVGTEG